MEGLSMPFASDPPARWVGEYPADPAAAWTFARYTTC